MATNPISSESLTVNYQSLMKIPVGDRVKAARMSSFAEELMASLTPSQMALAFPDYYRRQLPDISNFILANRYLDSGGKFHQTGGGQQGAAYPYYDGPDGVNPNARPGGVPEPTVKEMKEKLLKKGIDVDKTLDAIKKGALLEGDERLEFMKGMSKEELAKIGLQKINDENGKTLIQMVPSQYEGLTEAQVLEEYKKEFPKSNISPRERATLDFIAKREGSKDPNVIFGDLGGQAGTGQYSQQLQAMGYTKPLTEMTIAEVRAMQKDLIKLTAGRIGKGDLGTSAVGSGQMIGSTLEANLKSLGIPEDQWDNIKFDKDLQDRLTLQNFKSSGIGDPNQPPSTWNHVALGQQYESLDTRKHPPMSQTEMADIEGKSPVRPENKEDISPQDALIRLQQAENEKRYNEMIKAAYNKPSTTSSDYIQAPFEKGNITVQHGDSDAFVSRSSKGVVSAGIDNIDPRLVTLGNSAIKAFESLNPGYTVRVISGKRTEQTNSGSPTSRHLRGGAVDYEIVDPEGNVLPNLGGGKSGIGPEAGFSAPKYEEFGRYMEAARLHLAKDDPRYAENQVIAGMHFGGNWWMDSMHMQLGGAGALGDLYSGFKSPDQLRKEGQPEAIVQAVQNAIDAGAKHSINEEEMTQLSEFLYNEGKAPIEVIQKVNPTVAERLQKDLEIKEQNVAEATVPQKALGGNVYGLNEDLTLVETNTGNPVAQVNENEKLIKQGSMMQVTPETKFVAEQLSDNTSVNTTDAEEPQTSPEPTKLNKQVELPPQRETDNMWRESINATAYDPSPSYQRAMNKAKYQNTERESRSWSRAKVS